MQKFFVKWSFPKRYFVALMMGCGWFVAMILRSNLSIAMVEMTSKRRFTVGQNETYIEKAEFNWTSIEKGLILSSFSWGYLLSPLGGIMAGKVGGTLIFSVGLAITALLTLISPFLARLSITAFIMSRILEGVAEGFAAASIMDIYLYWAPPKERSRFISISCLGAFFSPALAYPICGYLAKHYGWQAVFFFAGGLVLLWFIIWSVFIRRTPATDRFISQAEKHYLAETINICAKTKLVYPWKEILKSKPVWILLNQRFVEAWTINFLLHCLPLFVKDINQGKIDEIGMISGIPHFNVIIGLGLSSFVADYLRGNKILSITKIHKILIGGGDLLCIFALIFLIFWMNQTGIIVCLSVYRFFNCFIMNSCSVLPLDIGQRYSSFLNGLGTTAVSIGYILNPLVMGFIVQNHTIAEWQRYFVFLSVLSIYGCLMFIAFGSGELQTWASPNKSDQPQTTEKNKIDADRGVISKF